MVLNIIVYCYIILYYHIVIVMYIILLYCIVGSKVQQVRTMAGTPSFASLDVHNGSTPMRKDDLESMVREKYNTHLDENVSSFNKIFCWIYSRRESIFMCKQRNSKVIFHHLNMRLDESVSVSN